MADKFGIGIVGAGMALRPHALSLEELKDRVDVRGIYSRSAERREAAAQSFNFPVAESLEQLLDDPKVDAIFVLTPPNARLELVKKIAKAGKHIFMEKPVERSTKAAQQIVDICDKAGVKLGITFQHRFRKGSLALRDMIASGSLGPLIAAHLVVPWWRPQEYYEEPGRGTFEQDGGGVLLTQAVHSMDLLLSFTGPVGAVQAMAGTTSAHSMETEDFVGAGWEFANGALGGLIATTAYPPGMEESMTLAFSEATAVLAGGKLDVKYKDGRQRLIAEKSEGTGGGADRMAFPFGWHCAQIAEFIDAVQEGREPYSNGHSALHVHRLIDALLLSSSEGRRISVAN